MMEFIILYNKCMKVLFTNKIPSIAVEMLENEGIECDVINAKKPKHILQATKKFSYDGIVTLLNHVFDKELIDALPPSVKIISNYAVGYNNIDIEAAHKRNIFVTNTPGVLTNTVAEHTVAMIFALSTRIVEADSFVRAGKFKGWEPELLLGMDLKGKTLGIIGAGRIGTRVAEILKGVGMDIMYYDITKNSQFEESTGARFVNSPEQVFKNADVISIHLPLNDETYHFVDSRRLYMCKSNALLVNASRGPVIDEKELIDVLKKGRIQGAALDVFEDEPNIPRSLRKMNNVILTPHIASASVETRNAMARIVAENISAVMHGGNPPNLV